MEILETRKISLPLPAINPRYIQRGLESLGNGLAKLYVTDCEGLTI
jgi:hypothetical protein